ncbi:hypothetical protein [Flavobacterium tistrianum]|uniref:hypothetical protein n=1 Tax=Flavobacterium tistrianum TaxID=1685414 RepID=UPI000DADD81D|nr:hypothetical protein [Flavobacterium tistrianum]KAF2342592.1 hypothetical protein DMB71_02770 [Flavobacterium tistrianum]
MSRENYDDYDQEDLSYHAADHSASDSINSETMEKKDPAINQHENESQRHKHTPEFQEREENENDTSDPFFQKNAPIAQDLDEDLKSDNNEDDDFDNDANRRTLDETKPDEDKEDDY